MGKKHTFPLNIFMLFHVEFHVGFLSVDIRHLHHIILISFHGQPAGKATMFLDFNPIFVETAFSQTKNRLAENDSPICGKRITDIQNPSKTTQRRDNMS